MPAKKLSSPISNNPRFFYGYIVVFCAFLAMMLIYTSNAFGVFFIPLLQEFGWTRAAISGASSLSNIMFGVSSILMGKLTDRFGPRIVITACGFLAGSGYLLMSQISAPWQLYLFYGVLVGAGLACWAPILSTTARWFVAQRSLMSGIVLSGLSIGGLIIPPAVTQLISAYDWRTSFTILGSIILVGGVLAAQFLKRDPAQIGQMPYGGSKGKELRLELTTREFTLGEALYTRQFWILFFAIFCAGFCIFSVIVHIVPHAMDLGLTAITAASILATMNGVGIVGRLVLGSIADKIGNRFCYAIAFILMSVTLFWLMSSVQLWSLYLIVTVFGFALAGSGTVESPLIADLFGLGSHGIIYGILVLSFTIGASIGPFLTGWIFDTTGSYQIAFLSNGCIAVIGFLLTVVLKPISVLKSKI